ncbi:MAG: 2,5-diamino-6-(ribosylamino)-4(3H)-pyrimidinone 5'-phosphate reductase [Methanoregulaceae archaeon]|nr:2,5-diamino-6-(ribosylamino)-4(3H)-pyrimidinone 5'-phosphate reductase [Methanoregulaceae archaeon]
MRPYVIVNVAMSADGKLSTRQRRQVRISGEEDFKRVDRLKAASDAVMVGIGTVLADDPSLTVKSPDLKSQRRKQGKDEHPIRVVVDSRLRIPPKASVLHNGEGLRVIACSRLADDARICAIAPLATVIQAGDQRVDLAVLLDELSMMGVRQLMVEGGGTLIWSLLEFGLVDEISCFIGGLIIGGEDAPTLADGIGFIDEASFAKLRLISVEPLDQGVLLCWKVIGRSQ